jgi:hypothetical protein
MVLGRITVLVASLVATAALVVAAPASAAWHYKFQGFVETGATASSAGITYATRCARSPVGDWRLFSEIEVDVTSSNAPKHQSLEIEVQAKLPVTTKFRPVHDVDVRWSATLPKDPGLAALMTKHYEALAKSQNDFYEGMEVRWRPAKEQLDIHHQGLYYDGTEQLAPDSYTTDFKPKPGC